LPFGFYPSVTPEQELFLDHVLAAALERNRTRMP
jgi:hypothetical protein